MEAVQFEAKRLLTLQCQPPWCRPCLHPCVQAIQPPSCKAPTLPSPIARPPSWPPGAPGCAPCLAALRLLSLHPHPWARRSNCRSARRCPHSAALACSTAGLHSSWWGWTAVGWGWLLCVLGHLPLAEYSLQPVTCCTANSFQAGMWEFKRQNTFGAAAFTSYGAFWMGFALLQILVAVSGLGMLRASCLWHCSCAADHDSHGSAQPLVRVRPPCPPPCLFAGRPFHSGPQRRPDVLVPVSGRGLSNGVGCMCFVLWGLGLGGLRTGSVHWVQQPAKSARQVQKRPFAALFGAGRRCSSPLLLPPAVGGAS
jgi:hypothetical protein